MKVLHELKKFIFRLNQKRIEKKIVQASERDRNFFFIQIGSNDGVSGDPIHRFVVQYGWRGILVEPVPYLYEKLRETYAGQAGLAFERVAIDREPGERMLYYIRSAGTGRMAWYEKLGSFSREHLMAHRRKIFDFDARFTDARVPCVTLASLFAKHDVRRVNLLHIDAEGYDYEIIKTIPFHALQPAMILYEDKHLNVADKSACRRLLQAQGYTLIKSKDTFAYRSDVP